MEQAVKVLQQGGTIAYPTEAVFGLGCDPRNIAAIKNLLKLKHREKEKGLILVAANFEQLKEHIQPLEKDIEKKLLDSWQDSANAITWLVPVDKTTSNYLKGQFDTLAIRVSHHPVVKKLCEQFGSAIVSTSANISTQEAARTAEQVKQIFENKIDFIVEGETDINAQPSEIRDALTDKIIRK
ncbi:MAG: Sua5/YciO/YrdC/YwlC family protein [Gammaproteobacteria bacterium]|nr:Sua5/YciO/YrdC/YwlC family protein [Gammaproteobacteria bacterium]